MFGMGLVTWNSEKKCRQLCLVLVLLVVVVVVVVFLFFFVFFLQRVSQKISPPRKTFYGSSVEVV